ncbi:hypothetical protein FHU36_002921 [Nonomuraea muscovyensis]|uniref:Uncharacterized protein n=1 Tax=Nonomuraea muscovyensis TaxID=1124761 RepID=A0A7X0EVY8_9ACTN|nr:hypothetical protein [Nonomuraea muscovyensis]
MITREDRACPLIIADQCCSCPLTEHGTVTASAADCLSLLECFQRLPDPRDPRGVRHALASLPASAAAAVLHRYRPVRPLLMGRTDAALRPHPTTYVAKGSHSVPLPARGERPAAQRPATPRSATSHAATRSSWRCRRHEPSVAPWAALYRAANLSPQAKEEINPAAEAATLLSQTRKRPGAVFASGHLGWSCEVVRGGRTADLPLFRRNNHPAPVIKTMVRCGRWRGWVDVWGRCCQRCCHLSHGHREAAEKGRCSNRHGPRLREPRPAIVRASPVIGRQTGHPSPITSS